MAKLTINRTHPKDPIYIQLFVMNNFKSKGATVAGLFDTGNDHTMISKALADTLALSTSGSSLQVFGPTGASIAARTLVDIGIEFDGGEKRTITNHEVGVVEGLSNHALIGRDFLERFDISITTDGVFVMTRA
ncbi:retropepsin-like aspartic protease [Sphingomonas asaccharolytica]|uniref:retropepsin-like aspartic protease n=1 Tax=Sphingomonas asaccharolytica TaxID=40681 RepID=UPI0008348163|nr:retropepsin-like aspartic protease [Sphingomonas asaccharolytica]